MRIPRAIACLLSALLLSPLWAADQEFEFRAPPSATDPSMPAVMRDLAVRMLPVYEEKDTERYLANVAALQLVAGNAMAAHDSRQTLRDRRRGTSLGRSQPRELLYDIYAKARAIEERERLPFTQAFTRAFQDIVPALSDRDAHAVTQWLETPLAVHQDALQRALDRLRAKGSIQTGEAVELVWAYLSFHASRSYRPLVQTLDSEDEERRYVEESVLIKIAKGVEIHAFVVRPKTIAKPLPALLEFTLYLGKHEAQASAAHGYVGVVAYTRGKNGKTRGRVMPFQHDGEDARAVIEWITKQPWSDGRVGMIGDGYSGFAAWAAAKRRPAALKAIATASPMAPGIDFPMAGNIHHNAAYRWAYTHAQQIEMPRDKNDDAQWRKRNQSWYQSGKPYRELDRRGKNKSDRVFSTWLDHPSYDRYWQKMIPFREGFAKIDIPVLTLAGYYAGDAGALHYFAQHTRYNAQANHTLLIGPYDDPATQGLTPVLRGYALDAAALIDLQALRYEWLDHIFKNAARPALLKDRVNYQLMGANEWRHAASLEAMSNASLRFYFAPMQGAQARGLTQVKPAKPSSVEQTVNLRERKSAAAPLVIDIISRSVAQPNSLIFESEPLAQAIEFSGVLAGQLDFTPNKYDVDLHVTAYEMLPGGTYIQLFDPYEFRASYAGDRTRRRLLKSGVRQQLAFTVERLSARRLAAGSRLVLVLGVNKRRDREINYGANRAVSEQSIADAKTPLKIRWYGESYIELPVRK